MKKEFIKYSLLVLVCFSIIACNDWLSVKPKTEMEAEDLFSTEAGFKDALAGVYTAMTKSSLYGREMTYGIVDVVAQQWGSIGTNHRYANALKYEYEATNTKPIIDTLWSGLYNAIANANSILAYIDKSSVIFTGDNKQIIKGEALALRAFLHFDLLRMYGTIYEQNPTSKRIAYRTVFNREPKEMQASNVVVDSIIADLKQAEILLTDTDPLNFDFPKDEYEEQNMTSDRFLFYRHKRMNLYAVKALLARVYLYAGNKIEAANYAKQVIDSKQFDFVADVADLQRSKEIVFSIYVDDFDLQVKEEFGTNGSYYVSTMNFLYEMFDVTHDGTNDFRIREGVSFDFALNGITTRKYRQENMWSSTEGTVVLIRLAEMYYVLAECAADAQTAAGYLNAVREARGVDPTGLTEATRLNEIEKEYRKEFYGEGQLFFFYKRHGYTTFLHCPVERMVEKNYMFTWPENEELFGMTN